MTSRVQKGGAVFRPVVKSRARPEARQPSVTADTSSGVQYVNAPLLSSALMPPPEITLSNVPTTSQIQSMTPVHPQSPKVVLPKLSASTESPGHPLSPGILPPTLVMVSSSRGTISPTVIGHPTPAPVISRPTPPPIVPLSSTAPMVSPNIQPSSAGVTPQPSSSSTPSHVLHYSEAENVPTSALNAPSIIGPQGPTTAKKAVATSSGVNQQFGVNSSLQQADIEPARPKKRSRSSRAESMSRKPPGKGKKKAVSISDAEESNDETLEPAGSNRKRRASSGTPKPWRSRGPSLAPYDPDADPGEKVDPTVVTMASLCSDTGQGRVSRKAAEILSNHAAWKTQNREKRAQMRALMELKKYGREAEAEALEANAAVEKTLGDASDASPSNAAAATPAIVDDTGSGFDYTQDLATSRFNVQVRIGPNGETIIDEESLVVDRTETEDTANYTHVVESDYTKFVNTGSYGKRYRGSRWSAEETELFYDALAQYGENYELIAYVLPGRDRKSCKNKFKAEDKKNPARINHCLNNNVPVDMATLSRMTGKDFSGPVPEIRVPTPQPIVEPVETTAEQNAPATDHVRKKPRKSAPDDEAMIVGEADSFVPFPASP